MVMGARLDMDETDPSTDFSLTSCGLANLVFRKEPNDAKKSCLQITGNACMGKYVRTPVIESDKRTERGHS
jgi:hypothetical protein